MNDLHYTIQNLPWSGLVPVALLAIVGLMLWIAGRRVLRTGFIIIGLGLGGIVGWMIGDSVKLGVQPWLAMCLGAGVLAVIAGLSYRFALVAALAVVCGVLSPMAVLTLSYGTRAEADTSPTLVASSGLMNGFKEIFANQNRTQSQLSESVEHWKTTLKESGKLNEENADRHLERVRSIARQTFDAGRDAWSRTPKGLRPSLIASSVIGTVAGFMLGILAPVLGASWVTSMGGSLLWLSSGRVLATGVGAPESWWPATGPGWFTLWLITASIGLVIQWAWRKRIADKTA